MTTAALILILGANPDGVQEIAAGYGLVRTIAVEKGRLRTVGFGGRATLAVQDAGEFRVVLLDGPALSASDYRVVGRSDAAAERGRRSTYDLGPRDPRHPRIVVEYESDEAMGLLKKRLRIEGNWIVDRLAVEHLGVSGPVDVGGFGQPIFLDRRWFFGLEHPAGENERDDGVLVCRHYPGKSTFTSPWAVVGSAGAGESVEEAFANYLDAVRSPAGPILQYNTWFDQRGRDLNAGRLRAAFDHLSAKLLQAHHLRLDAVVLDDGYQKPEGLWEWSASWPEGAHALARELEQKGTRLGLWLPLNGYGTNTASGERKGWERSDHRKRAYCLAGPNYQQAIRGAIDRLCREVHPPYLKHDFNFLECSRAGHGHLPTRRHGREANVDAQIGLLEHARRVQPGVYRNLTSNIWPSPWWLLHAEALWMGSGDLGESWESPQPSARAAEITYRDEALHRLLRVERAQVPLSALMTHGIIRGRHAGEYPGETLRDWSDYCVWFFARGTMVQELYLSPERIPEDWWLPLGRAIRWARANADTLADGRMIGGRPADGEPYGFLHWSAEKGIAALRNPCPIPATFAIPSESRPRRLPAIRRWHPFIVYPSCARLESWDGAAPLEIELPSNSIVLVELFARPPDGLESVPEGPFRLEASESGATLVTLRTPEGFEARPCGAAHHLSEWIQAGWKLEKVADRDVELAVVRRPASGASVDIDVEGHSMVADVQAADRLGGWELLQARWRPQSRGRLAIAAHLGVGPLASEQARITAILKARAPFQEETRRAMNSPPPWPLAIENRSVSEVVLLDDASLRKPRSPIEREALRSLPWLLIVALSMVLLGWFKRRERGFGRGIAC